MIDDKSIDKLLKWAIDNNIPEDNGLEIYFNAGERIPSGFPKDKEKIKDMEVLNLRRLEIKELPLEIFSLSNLKYLSLSENKLQTIPKEINKLKNLQELELSENELKELPNEFGELHTLTSLMISGR